MPLTDVTQLLTAFNAAGIDTPGKLDNCLRWLKKLQRRKELVDAEVALRNAQTTTANTFNTDLQVIQTELNTIGAP